MLKKSRVRDLKSEIVHAVNQVMEEKSRAQINRFVITSLTSNKCI